MTPLTFGQRLRALRERCNLSQQHVADDMARMFPDLHVSQTSVSAWEQRTDVPRGAVLNALASYYNVKIAYFVRNDEPSEVDGVDLSEDEQYIVRLYRAERWIDLIRFAVEQLDGDE